MPTGKTKAEDHYAIIKRVASEVTITFGLKPALKVGRVDWFQDVTYKEIWDIACARFNFSLSREPLLNFDLIKYIVLEGLASSSLA
jgi:hypothetical protein